MKKRVFDESSLPPDRAFVVQLREHTDAETGQWAGRVEHVTSGQAAHFNSLDDLVSFMTRILATPANSPDE